MACLILNISFFAILLAWEYLKYKKIKNPTLLVFFLYFLVAVCGVFLSVDNGDYQKMDFFCCVYFYIICSIAFIPLGNSIRISNIEVRETLWFKILLGIYFILAVITCYDYLLMLQEELSQGDWATLKENVYNNDIHINNGVISILARLYTQSLNMLFCVMAFIA